MASPPVANGAPQGKSQVESSLSEISRRYNVDGIDDDDGFDDNDPRRRGHTRNDQRDMHRMGKRQELIVSELHQDQSSIAWHGDSADLFVQRNFRPLSALSFAVVLQATWEFMLM